jgi:ABC-type spermidine/putrescine transport system permease subunit II
MISPKAHFVPTWRRTLQMGALIGAGLTFGYAALFIFYAVMRSSWAIVSAMPPDLNLLGALIANTLALVIASLTIATVFSLFSAVLGVITAATIKALDSRFNPQASVRRAMLIALVATTGIVLGIDFLCQSALGRSLNSLGLETYLFWFGLPGLLQIGAAIVGARALHQTHTNTPVMRNEVLYVAPRSYSGTL